MKDNERQEIEKFGQLQENGIFTMTIIGEIEGHQLSAQNAKTTKYEHMIPALAKVEQDESIKGILILINTIGGDVECGLAIAELKQTNRIACSWRKSFDRSTACCGSRSFFYCEKCNNDDSSSEKFWNIYRSYSKLS